MFMLACDPRSVYPKRLMQVRHRRCLFDDKIMNPVRLMHRNKNCTVPIPIVGYIVNLQSTRLVLAY